MDKMLTPGTRLQKLESGHGFPPMVLPRPPVLPKLLTRGTLPLVTLLRKSPPTKQKSTQANPPAVRKQPILVKRKCHNTKRKASKNTRTHTR